MDDWITKVYEPAHMHKLSSVRVSHRTSYHGQQYIAASNQSNLVARTVAMGKATIAARKTACLHSLATAAPYNSHVKNASASLAA